MNKKILGLLNNQEEYYPFQLAKQFPQLLDKLMIMWDSTEFDSYLNKFMLDKREHARQGFPSEVASEIFRLSMLHSELFGTPSTHSWTEPSNIDID